MLLIHVPRLTNRVGYTLNVVFHHILKMDFEITTDVEFFKQHDGARLCYGSQKVGDSLFVRSVQLLFQTNIEEQSPRCFSYCDTAALFPVYSSDADFPFDLFAASFFCLSRYEEYLPHITDKHGRFQASQSLAFKNGFHLSAVVDRWAIMVADKLRELFPDEQIPQRNFDCENTFDIDAAYCYKHKGIMRSLAGIGRDAIDPNDFIRIRQRLSVLFRRSKDPFDTFDFVLELHQQHPSLRLKFFPLLADYNVLDKPISYQITEYRQLLQHLCDYAKVGIHTSYASHDNPSLVTLECQRLSSILHRPITRNRFHFLRLNLPQSYNVLLNNDIFHDYTMGFADEPGFRAGTCTPFPFFDIVSDCETALIVHPFVVMDSTLRYYKNMTLDEVRTLYFSLVDECRSVGGRFCCLWHNESLCDDFGWEGWRDIFQEVIEYEDK